jgi:hypothetical protein
VAERLFGVETEYALTAISAGGQSLDRAQIIEGLMHLARRTLPHLPDEYSGGMFLQNGARFYVDAGHHPEFTTPELGNPWDAVRYIQAGERILVRLATEQPADPRAAPILFFRCNVDYGGAGSTWGCHESYMHRADASRLPKEIIPHLVSRLIYTGAGGFNNLSAGIEFTLSPRVPHISNEISSESTHSRGIFHTKDEPLCGTGHHRLHILCGESLCSELSTWLKVGPTALVIAMAEAGLCPGEAVRLRSPVEAMRAFASDPTCTAVVQSASGRRLTAIDIQRHYAGLAEEHAHDPFMPPWAGEVCRQWRAILDRLEGAPDSVATTLDWGIKLALYKDRARRHGLAWGSLAAWSRVADRLAEALGRAEPRRPPLTAELVMRADSPVANEVARLTPFVRNNGLSWSCLRSFLDLRQELFEIDMRFGQLGDGGIFATLDAAGALAHRVPGVDDIEHAVENPPDVARARRRGELVRQLSSDDDRYTCDWQGVWDWQQARMIDLADPFAPAPDWKEWTEDDEGFLLRAIPSRLHHQLTSLRNRARTRAARPR